MAAVLADFSIGSPASRRPLHAQVPRDLFGPYRLNPLESKTARETMNAHEVRWFRGSAWTMSLNFPNRSRSYDPTLRAVRFWGHDGAMEASFFVNEEALKRIQPGMPSDEAGILSAFDSHRDLIHATATKVYKRGRKGSYELIPADF